MKLLHLRCLRCFTVPKMCYFCLFKLEKKALCCFKKSNRPPAPAERRHWLARRVHGDELQTGAAAG